MKTSLTNRPKTPLLRVLGLSLLLPVSSSLAADISWTNPGTGDFDDGANWDSGTVPTETDVAIISNSGTAQITEGDHTVQQIAPGRNGVGTVLISGGSITTTTGPLHIGDDVDGTVDGNLGTLEISGTGIFNVNAGSVLFGFEDPEIEASDDAEGHLILSGDGQYNQTTGWFVLGKHGHGEMTISDNAQFRHTGGGNVNIGEHPTGSAEVNQSGGLLDTGDRELWIGNDGAVSTYNLSSGTLQTGNWTMIGRDGGNGTLNMTGGTINKVGGGNFIVGDFSTGIFNQTSGDVNINGEFWVGQGDPGVGTYTLDGGTITVNNWLAIGRSSAEGEFYLNGGTVTKIGNGNIELGNAGNSVALLHQTGGTLDVQAGRIVLGSGGANATYKLDGGSINLSDWLAIGLSGGPSTFTMTGGTITMSPDSLGNMVVGDWGGGTGTFTQSGGIVELNGGKLEVGKSDTVTGTVTLSGDATFSAGTVSLTENSTQAADGLAHATLTLTGNSILSVDRIDGNLFDLKKQGQSTIHFDGGTLRANRDEPAFLEHVFEPFVDAGGLKIDSNGFEVTILDPLINNGGDITKLGEGTVHLDGTTFYRIGQDLETLVQYPNETGNITIEQGTLTITTNSIVDGDVSAADGAGFGVSVHEEITEPLTLGSVSLAETTGNLDFDLGSFAESTVAPLHVQNLTANGEITVNVAGILTVGQRPLMTYDNLTGAPTFVIGSLGPGIEADVIYNVAEKTLVLDVTAAASLQWAGSVNGQWDLATENWLDLGTGEPIVFEDGLPVLFDDEATGTTDIILDIPVVPATLTFANNGPAPEGDEEAVDGLDYTLSGTGSIAGDIDLVKSGNGNVTINTANEYTGATLINGGSITATVLADGGQPSSIGASSADPSNLVLSGATFGYAGADATTNRGITFSGGLNTLNTIGNLTLEGPVAILQDSSLALTGSGVLTLSNPGEFTLGMGGAPAVDVTSGGLTLNGSGTQSVDVGGEMWLTGETGTEPSLVLNDTSLTVDSWLAISRGHSTTGLNSSVVLTNSQLQTGNFSSGYANGLTDYSSTADITLTDSAWTNNGITNISENSGSSTTFTLAGTSSFSSGGRFALGQGGGTTTEMVIKDDSSLEVNAWFNIGESGTATLTLQDNGSITTTGDFNVADLPDSTGTFNMSGNTTVSVGNGTFVGKNDRANGTFNISGGLFESLTSNEFQIGGRGPGEWNQTGGVVNASGWLAIGRHPAATDPETGEVTTPAGNGVLNISGGEFNQTQADRPIMVAEEGIGTLNISGTETTGGIVRSVGSGIWIAHRATGVGTVNLNAGGTLVVDRVQSGEGENTFNFDGGLLQAAPDATVDFMHSLDTATILAGGARIDTNGNDITIAQTLTGEGGLTKLGEGNLVLTGANTYTGATTVEAGGLGGTGAVNGDVTFAAGTDFVATGDALSDGLTVNGTLDITGANLVSSGILTEPVYVVATYTTLTGTFANINVPGYLVELNYEGTNQIALVVDPGAVQTYEQWATAEGLDPATDGARTADPDGDGIENLLEFAMGLTPTEFDAMPTATINGNLLELVYTRSVSASSQVNLTAEHATELDGVWSTDGVTDTSVEILGDIETRKASVAIDSLSRGFLRLRASEPVE